MRDWFEGLEDRERRVLITGAVFLTLFLLYWFIVGPLYSNTAEARARIETKEEDLRRMQTIAARFSGGTQNRTAAPQTGSLVVLVQRAAGQFDLEDKLKNSRPVPPASVSVRFEEAPFDSLIQLLGELQGTYGLNIQSASFSDRGEAGRVQAQVVLARAGG